MDTQPKKIVLAEDQELIARAYSIGLTRAGFDVTLAPDGEAALELVRSIHPDMVLLDLMMPKMNGFNVLSAMQSDNNLKSIPVFILSNLSQETDQKQAEALGAKGFLIKSDHSLQEIVQKVKEYFG